MFRANATRYDGQFGTQAISQRTKMTYFHQNGTKEHTQHIFMKKQFVELVRSSTCCIIASTFLLGDPSDHSKFLRYFLNKSFTNSSIISAIQSQLPETIPINMLHQRIYRLGESPRVPSPVNQNMKICRYISWPMQCYFVCITWQIIGTFKVIGNCKKCG